MRSVQAGSSPALAPITTPTSTLFSTCNLHSCRVMKNGTLKASSSDLIRLRRRGSNSTPRIKQQWDLPCSRQPDRVLCRSQRHTLKRVQGQQESLSWHKVLDRGETRQAERISLISCQLHQAIRQVEAKINLEEIPYLCLMTRPCHIGDRRKKTLSLP